MNKTLTEQALAALSGGSGMLYVVYLALFGGLGFIVIKAIRGQLGDWLRRWVEGLLSLPWKGQLNCSSESSADLS